ncbi:ATP-binding protein [Bacillus carboniphilus]|uniref:histidine kinase n=1 Tax=Bacillus carboniphilus TaxID=86663 RepID=A0ABY9JVB1_9BACI|nr:ATP-binding protein [Bacillus carboniphilus]WLR42734.1 ATP-binding protein [Bacillus carboniphilus]
MKLSSLSLYTKVRLIVFSFVLMTIGFSFIFIDFLYQELYIQNVEDMLIDEGERISAIYQSGPITEEFKEKINFHNSVSESEVMLIDNPRELSACLPFEIGHDSLIGEEERRTLLSGEMLLKTGYEERFNRTITGVVLPLLDNQTLHGVIYLYLPLEPIEEVFTYSTPILIGSGGLFFIIIFFIVDRMTERLLTPIEKMIQFSRNVSKGDFSKRVPIETKDEVGKLAEAFNQMSESLHLHDQHRRDFLANVAHELRTPLTYIKGYSHALKENIFKSKEEANQYSELIDRETDRMKRLVTDLLDLAQLEEMKEVINKQPFVFSQLIEDTIERFIPILNERSMTLKKQLNDEIIFFGDYERMMQVVYNLIENAIRYSDDGSSIHVQLTLENKNIFINIIDYGMGMSEEDVKHIGERFFRADKARSRTTGGTGLGLAIVKQIIQLHEGELKVFSELGKGTTFTVVLPYEEM